MQKQQQFYLTLPSNSSKDYYPANKASNFITQLTRTVTLNSDGAGWEVALVEAHFPCSFLTVSKNVWIRLTISTKQVMSTQQHPQNKKQEENKKPLITLEQIREDLEPADYGTINELLNTINKLMRKYEVTFIYDEHKSKLIQLQCNEIMKNDLSTISVVSKIRLSKSLALQLGFDPRYQASLANGDVSSRPADINLSLPSQMYVYCDLVEPQLVGDTMAPLLKIIDIDTSSWTYGANKTVHIYDPHYVPTIKSSFETVEMDLRDDTGASLPFAFGNTCMKLHLRKAAAAST